MAASNYTAADVLAKLKTVDGAGSGLDADLLDGKQSGHFLAASSYTAADVLAKLKTVDGAGSGLDADRVDGFQASQFLRSDTSDTIHGNLTIQEELFVGKNGGGDSRVHFYDDNSNTWRSLFWDDSANDWRIEAGNGSIQKLWHQGNDGSGSGLDADLLDGQQASAFARLSGASYSGTVSAPNFASTSDARLKSKIAQIGSALELVQSLTGVRYEMDGAAQVGVIAQDVEPHLPEVVNKGEDGYLRVSYGQLVAPLIEAVKELAQRVDQLEGAQNDA